MKVYNLEFSWNNYDQLGTYVIASFMNKPTGSDIKKFFTDNDTICGKPVSEGKDFDICCEELARECVLCEYLYGGGDSWHIFEVEIIEN